MNWMEKALIALAVLVVIGVMVPVVGMAIYYIWIAIYYTWSNFFAAIGVI